MKVKILIIDDQEAIAMVLKEYLSDHGFHIDVALNGKAAIQSIRSQKYHILLTDYKLPDMDGAKVVELSKRILPNLKIIFITAHIKLVEQLKNKIGPTFQIIEKPCRPKLILDVINKMV